MTWSFWHQLINSAYNFYVQLSKISFFFFINFFFTFLQNKYIWAHFQQKFYNKRSDKLFSKRNLFSHHQSGQQSIWLLSSFNALNGYFFLTKVKNFVHSATVGFVFCWGKNLPLVDKTIKKFYFPIVVSSTPLQPIGNEENTLKSFITFDIILCLFLEWL